MRSRWRLPSGLTVGLAADDDSNSADENAPNTGDLLAIAESLAFTTVAEPPSTTIDEDTPPEDRLVGEPQIAGTLDGVPWSAQVDPGALRTMFVYVDGRRNSGFENDRLSQPSDLPAAGPGEISLSGIDGSGAIIFGYTSPEVDRILVRRTDGQAALLPVFGRDLESYFAIPVPDGLTIETITFLTGDGLPYRVATIPPLPAGLGGTYGGYIEAVRPEATAASAPSADGAETPVAPIGADVEAAARLDAEQEAARVAARGAAEPFVGQTLDEFKRSVGDLGYVVRVTSIDGRPQPARADLRLDRINVGVDGSTVVTSIASVG